MRRSLVVVGLVLSLIALASGCGSDDDGGETATEDTVPGTTDETAPTPEDGPSVEGVTWELDAATSEHPDGPLPEVNVQLRFEAGRVSGSDGCNRIMGSYQLDGGSLHFGELAGTMMACLDPPDVMDRAARYVAALEAGGTVELVEATEDGAATLVIVTGNGATLRYQPEPEQAPLEATSLVGTWEMTLEERSGEGAEASVSASASGTITFAEDGSVSGQGPCNSFNGDYTADDTSAFDIPLLTQTFKSCGPASNELEAATLAHLQAAANWGDLPGGTVELIGDDTPHRILLSRPA